MLSAGLAWVAMFACACGPVESMRLGRSVLPISQELYLEIDAARDWYSGRAEIELDVRLYTSMISFHALDIDFGSVVLQDSDGSTPLNWTVGPKGLVTARAEAPLRPGRYTLKIKFTKDFNRKGVAIYKTEHAGEPYVFTQFEPQYAREAFPCWDDPSFKINWRITVRAPKDHMVVSNTPPGKISPSGKSRTIRFDRTRPMPSYLLAIAAGPLEAVDVKGMSVPGRIITAKGQKRLAATAQRISPPLLQTLEEYFECPYPYAKLDQIAVPEFTFGAMENAGAITYRDTILLKDPITASASQKRRQALVVAHEMAHMWFGNLVTPKWWDDLWLNESFASWMALKTVRKNHPEFDLANNDIHSRERAMGSDSSASTRAIRREVRPDENMTRLFNALAYQKGMSVLTMVEDWLGVNRFRRGMVRYMSQHRWGNADAFDLAAAMSSVDDSDINAIVKDFVTMPGIPVVKVEFTSADTVRLTQSRYRLLGDPDKGPSVWTIPVILRYSDGSREYTQRVLMTQGSVSVKLKAAILRTPGGWIYPNADEKGYYRWSLETGELSRLARIVRENFDSRRKLGFLGNVASLFYAGDLQADEFLGIIGSFNLDYDPEVVAKVAELMDQVHLDFITPDTAENYAVYLRDVLGKSLRETGLSASPDDTPHTVSLRGRLMELLGEKGGDVEVMKLAGKKASEYVKNPASVDPELAVTFLRLSAITGDARLFDKYADKFENAKDPTERANYLEALSNFRDPQLMGKALDYAMNGPVKPNRVYKIVFGQAWDEPSRARLFNWVVDNFDAIKRRVPVQALPYYPYIADGRSRKLLDKARRFFLSQSSPGSGTAEVVEEVANSVNLRLRLYDSQHENIVEFLDKVAKRSDKDRP